MCFYLFLFEEGFVAYWKMAGKTHKNLKKTSKGFKFPVELKGYWKIFNFLQFSPCSVLSSFKMMAVWVRRQNSCKSRKWINALTYDTWYIPLRLKVKLNKTGVINEPLGQTTVSAGTDCRLILTFWDRWTDSLCEISDHNRPGLWSASWINNLLKVKRQLLN